MSLEPANPRHRLQPLLEPTSIAVVGASARANRPGYDTLKAAQSLGWSGRLFAVSPRYTEIDGIPCVAAIGELPEPVDLAIIAGSVTRLAGDVERALEAGARSILIYGNPRDADTGAAQRLRSIIDATDVPLLGPNTIGYVNYARTSAATWVPPAIDRAGGVAAIIQSGATYANTTLTDPRVGFSLSLHPGQEWSVSTAELIDYALELEQTRVLALYLETINDGSAFATVLDRASRKSVPVVVLKPGRSEGGQAAVATHTGRMAGGEAIVDALLRKHHAMRVNNMDEWWTTLCLLSHVETLGPGALSVLTDSGAQKALLIDEAEALDVPLTRFSDATCRSLRKRLAPDLKAENPIDFWGGEENLGEHVAGCLRDALADDGTAIAMVTSEYGVVAEDAFTNRVAECIREVAREAVKPVVACSYSARQFHPQRTHALNAAGIAVLDSAPNALRAVRHAFRFRDRVMEDVTTGNLSTEDLKPALTDARSGAELHALALLRAAGINCVQGELVQCESELDRVCANLSFPVVLKTAESQAHKSDVGGVILNLADPDQAALAYRDLAARLGPRVLVQTMAASGVEIALGVANDPQFGPTVMLASGGTLVELFDDRVFTLAPVSEREARRMVEQLRSWPLLQGYRGKPSADIDSLVDAVVNLSALAVALRNEIASIDVNPVIVNDTGLVAVDALIEFRDSG